MLASITPLGERGRHARWGITVTAFLLGSVAAGTAAGALLGALGQVALTGSVGARARLAVLAVALAAAVALDLRPGPAPGPRRQVNEHWLDQFRGWVYGVGFGAQLGLGVTTVISSAATYVALVAAFLAANPVSGAAIVGCFGAVRGLEPVLAARVHRPDQLISLHRVLDRLRGPARTGVTALLAVTLIASVIGAAS